MILRLYHAVLFLSIVLIHKFFTLDLILLLWYNVGMETRFTNENARSMQLLSAQKRKQNRAERLAMQEVAQDRVTQGDRLAICEALLSKARDGDVKSITLLLQILGEMPDTKQTIDVHTQTLCEADLALIRTVQERYKAEAAAAK